MGGLHLHLPCDLATFFNALATKQDLEALRQALMTTLDEVLAKVEANTTLIGSLDTLLDGIRQQIQEILSGVVIPPAVQAKVDSLFAQLNMQGDKVVEMITENTPLQNPPPGP